MRKFLSVALSLILLGAVAFSGATFSGVARAQEQVQALDKFVYLPMISKQVCPSTSANSYFQGLAIQWDEDQPVRPKNTHAGKNFDLRGYAPRTTGFTPSRVDYGPGSEDPNGIPPQFNTLFNPTRLPGLAAFYQMYDWNYAAPPDPGTRGGLLNNYLITALGLTTTAGEIIRTPNASTQINPGYVAMLIWADADSLTIAYTRADSSATGYTVYIDGLCTDPNLLALYNSLDGGARYVFSGKGSETYNLPYLQSGKPLGVAKGTQIVVAITDTGAFQDPRSCRGWWIDYQNDTGICPDRNGSTILSQP